MLKVMDMFCGGGGLGLGFQQAGYEIPLAFDFDKYAVESYRANVGNHVQQMDINKVTWRDLPKADVWAFGFPCTDISRANMKGSKRERLQGKNSGLFYQVMRLLDEVAENVADYLPKILVAENVEDLKDVLSILKTEYEKRGYIMQAQLFDSKDWGVAQHRLRYFVIGRREGMEELSYPVPDPTQEPKRIADILDPEVPESYYYPVDTVKNYYVQIHRDEIKSGELNQVGTLNVPGWLDYMGRVYSTEGISPTLTTCQGGHRQTKIIDKGRVRKLTPTEYGRLQGFPTTWKQVVSNSQAYKQFGNAVTVKPARAVAKAIKELLEGV